MFECKHGVILYGDKCLNCEREKENTAAEVAFDKFNLERFLVAQREFSLQAFGPSPRLVGVHDHLAKEIEEAYATPTDVLEWADCLLLSFDGAMRAGGSPQELALFMDLSKFPESLSVYKGVRYEVERDVRLLKAMRHLEVWKAWGIIASKVLIAAFRNGHSMESVLLAAEQKLSINQRRTWPDWRSAPLDKAIEHYKGS